MLQVEAQDDTQVHVENVYTERPPVDRLMVLLTSKVEDGRDWAPLMGLLEI